MKGPLAWLVPRQFGQAFNFVLMYFAYVAFYFCRKNYAFWLNELIQLGKAKEEVAVFGSVMEIAYGVGKVITGPIVDAFPPSVVLCGSLVVSAGANISMFKYGFYADLILWSANGFAQSGAWMGLSAIFLNWFATSKNRATWYSVLSTNQNVGSALTPILLTPIVRQYGWQASVVAPGFFGLLYASILFLFVQEYPHEHYQQQEKSKSSKENKEENDGNGNGNGKGKDTKKKDLTGSFRKMLTSFNLISLGIGYAFLTLIRVGIQDWSFVLLSEFRGVPKAVARDCMVLLEGGAFFGGIGAGIISDRLFASRRGPVLTLFTGCIAPLILCLFYLDVELLRGVYFLLGFCSFGPHMLVGLTAREMNPQAPSSAGSFTKSIAQVGGSMAGYPLSQLLQAYGWQTIGLVWMWCAVLGCIAFLPLLRVGAYKVEDEEKKKA